ncbi:MAG: DNA-3-methyladenine glycosylase 2 family protein [Bacteroidetes bacterium]|nr:DNA-3-methyladenine glycosylase 2 family protein [Chitinophagales bacterium]MDA0197794.1 DNA-3-methyladenine glycosylase 2 family protein [Bacteroidota bacterium]
MAVLTGSQAKKYIAQGFNFLVFASSFMPTPLASIQAHLADVDPVMSKIIANHTIKYEPTNYQILHELMSGIIGQQLSGKAALAIEKKYLALYDGFFPTTAQVLNTPITTLRTAGLSNAKAQYLQNIAAYWEENHLHKTNFEALTDHEILQLLTPIKGVGTWTVQMLLMFTLFREDVLPVLDLGIRKAMALHYQLNLNQPQRSLAQAMETIAEPWKPYRSIASRYLWRSLDDKK